ncbi:MAG TPA: non-canonical purine NTP pyrophosphatase, RdgB/HAM1 family [Chloroflexi bacterium]|nr:non-canonical purine NTP pyrophosphatase, RdgB/HAM1 family [Chloroflexota bacterium]HCU97838.1 non-canonical purine NTP pyrophosphatase, RdgB/HAM1 family [Chloroflexota bacterium]|tara:strand:- start:2777 stop:3376 length:600 start_codon:yes stop_codon:yes gene_type:complete
MKTTIVIATHNNNKAKEIQKLMAYLPVEFITLNDLGIEIEVEENGKTIKENAIIKSQQYSKITGLNCLSDDSGLIVNSLDGRPGIHTARYGGIHTNYDQKRMLLLQEMYSIPWIKRHAQFKCTLALTVVQPNKTITTEGVCKGMITESDRGSNGFGYDPIFYLMEKSCTMAELDENSKNTVSHRAIASENMKNQISSIF